MTCRDTPVAPLRAHVLVAAALLLLMLTAPAVAQEGLGFDPLAPGSEEPTAAIDEPNSTLPPIFSSYFGPPRPDAWGRAGDGRQFASITVGDGETYVASTASEQAHVYNATTLAFKRSIVLDRAPRAIDFYRGELYALSTDGRLTVHTPTGVFVRELKGVLPELTTQLRPYTGISLAWGEAWITFMGGPAGGGIAVLDATTGALKHLMWHAPRYGCTFTSARPADLVECFESLQAAITETGAGPGRFGWWDIAAIPDVDGVLAQCRFVERNPLVTAASQEDILNAPSADPGTGSVHIYPGYTLPDDATNDDWCKDGLYQDGTEAVWGMNWLLAINGTPSIAGNRVNEYKLHPGPDHPLERLELKRSWQPRDAASNNHRDIAYQNRDVRIDWSGNLTEPDWQRATQCLDYIVSDADIYLVGHRGEHWLEQARNFERVELAIDGTVKTTSTLASGQLCIDTATIASGRHVLTLTAAVAGKILTKTNDQLHLDNTPPAGALDPLPKFISDTVTVSGTMNDTHSGPRDWELQAQPSSGDWRGICPRRDQAEMMSGRYRCDWQTNTGAYPDGPYNLRAAMRDQITEKFGGPNVGYPGPGTVVVDNTPPELTLSGELKDGDDARGFHDGDDPQVVVDASDAGSGIVGAEFLIDGVPRDSRSQSCPAGGCNMGATFTFIPAEHADAPHTITVRVSDGVGHTRVASWGVEVERVPPEPDVESTGAATLSASEFPSPPGFPTMDEYVASGATLDTSDYLACEPNGEPPSFPVFTLGNSFEDLPLTATLRRCDLPLPEEPIRANFTSYIYGDCLVEPAATADDEPTGCTAPLDVQSWPACERNLSSYSDGSGLPGPEYESLTVDGVPAASFDDGQRLELYAGASTIVIFGHDTARIQRAAGALFSSGAGGPLPPALAGTLGGSISCLASLTSHRGGDL